MSEKKVLIWSKAIDDIIEGRTYGIAVQLSFWAQVFTLKGWQVTTLSDKQSFIKDGINFIQIGNWGKLEIFHEWMSIIWMIMKIRPRVILLRGADRVAYPLVVLSKLFRVKFVFFGASDVNFEPGKELMAGGNHNRVLWQKAVDKMNYIVVQNQQQHDALKKHYNKESLVLYSIWGRVKEERDKMCPTDVIWIANFRQLKRPEWLIETAKSLPNLDFTMIGGPSTDKQYFEEIKEKAQIIPNIHFMGTKSFEETNAAVFSSRILCCTSIFEGFPNTFLQAWSRNKPVISTVDPSNIITTYNLGCVVDSLENFKKAVLALINDETEYIRKSKNVERYFNSNHSPEKNFERLLSYINE